MEMTGPSGAWYLTSYTEAAMGTNSEPVKVEEVSGVRLARSLRG